MKLHHLLFSTRKLSLHVRHFSNRAKLSPLADKFNYHIVETKQKNSAKVTGLFDRPELRTPEGFHALVAKAVQDCHLLVEEATSEGRVRKMVQVLDDISDELCRVADLADCMRMLHPDESYRLAASEACHSIGQLVEELNTHYDLYNSSVRACNRNSYQLPIDKTMDAVDQRVLDLFIADFELSGIQLKDPNRHAQYVRSASRALKIGAEFIEACHTPATFPPNSIFQNSSKESLSNLDPIQLIHPLTDHPDPGIRLTTYLTYYAPLKGQEDRLDKLLQSRHEMALAAGFDAYVKRATLHSLAETPDRVQEFLNHVCHKLAPLATNTVREQLLPIVKGFRSSALEMKISYDHTRIWPWDLPYALGLRRQAVHNHELDKMTERLSLEEEHRLPTEVKIIFGSNQDQIKCVADYFSLGACMEGVSQLAECLFGLKLQIEPIKSGETWHPDVIKVCVYSKSNTHNHVKSTEPIGIVYCDLLDRPGKPAQDCHYTIRGGRCLSGSHSIQSNSDLTNNYQCPIITLQLTLSSVNDQADFSPPLLSLGQVENLFHEWGHALHSMLARTRYQHVTGTRCSTDLAELPSTLFEHFALDPRVIVEYARHWKTGKRPNPTELETLQRLALGRNLGQSMEISQQATYAILDQTLHSNSPENILYQFNKFGKTDLGLWPCSTKLLSSIQYNSGLGNWLNCEPNHLGAWPHRFSHLVNYGGRYYAYLMARAGADLVWRRCFAQDPWSSSEGKRYVDKLLCHGGEYHPLNMLSNLLSENDDDDDSNNNHISENKLNLTIFDENILSSKKLAEGLTDQIEENELNVCSLLNNLQSPGLHQPEIHIS